MKNHRYRDIWEHSWRCDKKSIEKKKEYRVLSSYTRDFIPEVIYNKYMKWKKASIWEGINCENSEILFLQVPLRKNGYAILKY